MFQSENHRAFPESLPIAWQSFSWHGITEVLKVSRSKARPITKVKPLLDLKTLSPARLSGTPMLAYTEPTLSYSYHVSPGEGLFGAGWTRKPTWTVWDSGNVPMRKSHCPDFWKYLCTFYPSNLPHVYPSCCPFYTDLSFSSVTVPPITYQ